MIYCYGLIEKYEAALDRGDLFKQGQGPGYAGGHVFRTFTEAQAFLLARGTADIRRVYGLLADWEADTSPVIGETFRRLMRRAQIVRVAEADATDAG